MVHVSVGVTGLFAGYAIIKGKAWSRGFLLAVNSLIIVYSAFSESTAQIESLLRPDVTPSLIGTVIAIITSGMITYLLILKS